MNKQEVQKRVLQNGTPLDLDKFSWDEKTKTFSTNENNLVLDFSGIDGVTFKTSYGCMFKTGYGCTFDTGYGCMFKTSYGCMFKTGYGCTFDTGYGCMFKTGYGCMFKTGYGCTFDTGSSCTFDTGNNCTFKTLHGCTFDTGNCCTFNTTYECKFKTGSYCVILRSDTNEVIQPKENQQIKLNGYQVKGYQVIKTHVITIDGKDIILSEESFNQLKKSLLNS